MVGLVLDGMYILLFQDRVIQAAVSKMTNGENMFVLQMLKKVLDMDKKSMLSIGLLRSEVCKNLSIQKI